MGMLILEAIGSEGERLAMEAGERADVAVGWDSELNCATFDSDARSDEELEVAVFQALTSIDSDWRTHLRVAE